VTSVAFSPNNQLLASASPDHTVCLYDISNYNKPRHITTLKDHNGWVTSIALSPDNQLLISASVCGTMCLYDISNHNNPRLITTLKDHDNLIFYIAFSPNNQFLASTSYDKTVYLYDIGTYIDTVSWLRKDILIKQALLLIACQKNPLDLVTDHINTIFDKLPDSIQTILKKEKLVQEKTKFFTIDKTIILALLSITAGHFLINYLAKKA